MKNKLSALLLLCFLKTNSQNIDKDYATYDFIAGETTIFEDKFIYGPGEKIADHWEFMDGGGAASVRDWNGEKVLSFDAFYTRLKPRIFGNKTLPDDFTVEYDAWLDPSYDSNTGVHITFELADGTRLPLVESSRDRLRVVLPNNESISKDNPSSFYAEKFFNRWVHFSVSVFKNKMMVYIDQFKVLEIPDILAKPKYILVNGDKMGEAGNGESPMLLKNFRLATGFPVSVFENGKFITHNIKFDVNKSVLKPESIAAINQVKAYLDKHPSAKIEIDGHTDSDGPEEANVLLSQLRADAVKNQLISMGIASDRMTTKGYGEAAPIDKSNTPEAKANNRRVEFVIIQN
ncbi:MAG: OmpA family protein [Bacteroidia bacterium]